MDPHKDDEDKDTIPGPDHHDGDEWIDMPDAQIAVETADARITVMARGETAVGDCQRLLDMAIDAVGRLRVQMQ